MKMCYHATCIYSFCGHSSTSQGPSRNTPLCPHRATAAERPAQPDRQAQGHAIPTTTVDTDINPTAFPLDTSFPFPSPQEFEFARSLHHSVPASPITPTSTSTLSQRASQISASSLTSIGTRNPIPRCCESTRSHPFRTFILPTLCPPCRIIRDENIARFEAKAIRGIVEREGGDGGNVEGGESGNGDVEGDRSRECSIRRRGKKKMVGRKLMPLILVEEGRLKKEIETAVEENQGVFQMANDLELRSRLGSVAAGSDGMVEGWRSSVEIRAGIGGAVEVITPAATPSLPDLSTRAGTPPASSKWNWWNRKALHAQSNSVSAVNGLDLKLATRADIAKETMASELSN